jgi:hypothetical protein
MKKDFVAPYHLIKVGDIWTAEYSDLETLAAVLRGARIVVSDQHIYYNYLGKAIAREWIVRDDFGQIVTHEDIFGCSSQYGWWYVRRRYSHNVVPPGYPVPGTGKRGSWRCYRNQKFLGVNRARAAFAVDERDMDVHPKGKVELIPTCWDDLPRDNHDRNWKRFRKTQWRSTTNT